MVEDGTGAGLLLELAVAGGDLGHEFVGGYGLAGLEDVGDALGEDGAVHDAADGGGLVGGMGEVVGADGEVELGEVGVVAEVEAADVAHGGDLALGGDGEDVVGVDEEVLAEVACGGCLLAEVVVADEEEAGLGVVEDVADDAAELCGDIDAAEGHEVVDVVDDDECWVELLDELLDAAVEGVEVVTLVAEDVEAGELELGITGNVGL